MSQDGGFAIHRALEAVWRAVQATNAYATSTEPWKHKDDGDYVRGCVRAPRAQGGLRLPPV